MPEADPKYRVTMRNVTVQPDGEPAVLEAVDFVPSSILDAYVADARTRWQSVDISSEADPGPGGAKGATTIPENLVTPDPGTV